jgi:hypothetical protein
LWGTSDELEPNFSGQKQPALVKAAAMLTAFETKQEIQKTFRQLQTF